MARVKKNRKKTSRHIIFLALRTVVFFSGAVPLGTIRAFARVLGRLVFLCNRKQQKIALDSLSIAFPKKSVAWRKSLAKEFFINMISMPFEVLYYLKRPESLGSVALEGKEFLDNALAKEKGVIGLTAHMGCFPLMHLKLARAGYPVNVVTRPMRDSRTGNYFNNIRKKKKIKTIYSLPRREVVEKTLKSLRSNQLVIIQMDQNFGKEGIKIDFFGKLASTPTGPIAFALRTGAVLIPMIIVRDNTGRQRVRILPELILEKTNNYRETIRINALKYNNLLEGWIRLYPSQWGWIHRRWDS